MPMKVRKAVFPAAGLGTRFLPATKAQPKEMLPLVDKPIIQYGVEEAMASGCDQIVIITGRGKQAIEDHFDVSYELEKMLEERGKTDLLKIVRNISDMMYVAYVRQKEALGLGHAVLMARELVGNEPFAVLLADDVIDNPVPCLKQMVDVFDQKQCSVIAAQVVEGKMISSYGVFDAQPAEGFNGRLFEIRNMVEKPKPEEAPSNLAIIGRYILTPAIFDCLAKTKDRRRRRTAAHRRHAHVAKAGKNVRLRLRRPPLRYRRQTGIPESHSRIRTQAQRPRRPLPRVSKRPETHVGTVLVEFVIPRSEATRNLLVPSTSEPCKSLRHRILELLRFLLHAPR